MWGLLAMIGLIAVIYCLAKALKKLGTWMVDVGDSLCDSARVARKKPVSVKGTVARNKILQDKITNFSSEEAASDAYNQQVRKEIDALTRDSAKSEGQ